MQALLTEPRRLAAGADAPTCPLTGKPMAHWLRIPCDWRRSRVNEQYNLFWSSQAKFGQLYPRPTRAEVASFYEVDYYTHGTQAAATIDREKGFWERLREHLAWRMDFGTDITAAGLVQLTPSKTPCVLEIGCGDGKLLADLRGLGATCVGIEPDPVARMVAAERGVEVHDGTAEEPARLVPREAFDLVVLQHVLEHCLDPIQALRVARTYLKPGGVMVIETPNNEAAGCQQTGEVWPWLDVPRHLNFFTGHSLRLACQAAGMNIIATEHTGYTRQFQRPWHEMEDRIIAAFREHGFNADIPSFSVRSWKLLLTTAMVAAGHKYDSVRVIAKL